MPAKHISYSLNSYEALSHFGTQVNKVALVTEGGGQRGIFTAGVLDAFLGQNFNPFSLMIGTSAGSLNLASYICGQTKHAYHFIKEATVSPKFFTRYQFLTGQQGLDLDWLLRQAMTTHRLDWDKGHANMHNCEVLACACHATEHKPAYFNLDSPHWPQVLKASCAIPFINKKPVKVCETEWLDGGVSAPIPVQEAYHRGYKHIVVIRTVPLSTVFDHQWIKKYSRYLGKTKLKALIDLLLKHEECYRATQAFLNSPPSDATIYEIHPHKALHSNVLGSSSQALDHDYETGRLSGEYFLATAGKFMSKNKNTA